MRSEFGRDALLTFHQVIVLGNLLGRTAFLDIREQRQQNVLRKWLHISLRESDVSFIRR